MILVPRNAFTSNLLEMAMKRELNMRCPTILKKTNGFLLALDGHETLIGSRSKTL